MSAYWALFSARFRGLLQYRWAALGGLATQVFWGFIRIMIFEAFYRSSTAAQPMTLAQVITFVWLSQALFRLIPMGIDWELAQKIRDGSVVYEAVKPLDLYGLWFARTSAGFAAPTLLRAVPMLLLALPFFGMQPPASFAAGLVCAVSIISAVLLGSAITTLASISMLWTISGDGIARLIPAAVWVFSGIVVPLPFFPEWLQPLINFLPFRGLLDTPFRIYSGQFAADQWLGFLAHQAVWTLSLILLGRVFLGRGVRRMVAQGG